VANFKTGILFLLLSRRKTHGVNYPIETFRHQTERALNSKPDLNST
jgi:hypothetical protein